MIDISDGLVQDLSHILEESKTGAVIFEKAIPKNRLVDLKEALYEGEDFELLFTMSKKEAQKLFKDKLKKKIKFPVKPIGIITKNKEGFTIIDESGRENTLRIEGFRHF